MEFEATDASMLDISEREQKATTGFRGMLTSEQAGELSPIKKSFDEEREVVLLVSDDAKYEPFYSAMDCLLSRDQ